MVTKRQVFDEFATVARALSHGLRLQLLEYLFQSERTVEQLAELTGEPMANVSQHLQVLKRSRMVEVRKQGLYSYYRTAGAEVFRVWTALRVFGESRVSEIKSVLLDYLNARENLEAVSATELISRIQSGDVTVIDVRPHEEFEAAHLPGAVSIPLNELPSYLGTLRRRQEIVAYCRGPYCVQSDAAVAALLQKGYKARRLEIGLPEWLDQGFPVEHGAARSRCDDGRQSKAEHRRKA